MKNLEKIFSPKEVEQKQRDFWKKNNFNRVETGEVLSKKKKPFSILMPPPNVTGSLTIGHVLNHTIQDILIRYHRLTSHESLWLPGTDHAGIATQTVVEKKIKKERLVSRYDLGRDNFLKEVWKWKNEYGELIVKQLQTLGISCNWDRSIFTMDKNPSEAVTNAFIKLYNDGLIYKGKRIINWCPASQTALSDEEVIMKERTDQLVYLKYISRKNPLEFISVATVRPETILADVAVAVNPADKRYRTWIGEEVIVPIVNRSIPVIADSAIEIEFGTGVLKVTPAHDPIDYDIASRHHLPIISAIGQNGKITYEGDYHNLDRFLAREKIIDDLTHKGLLIKKENYTHNVGYSERSDVVVEPRLSEQWFVKTCTLAKDALTVVENEEIKFYPKFWINTYNHWMKNVKDWCISRQLWWGHRIPIYYLTGTEKFVAAKNKSEAQEKFKRKGVHVSLSELRQEEDVLDTWFSSWLWPLTTFGWTKEGDDNLDFQAFYPTSTLVTGPDIIFFWVARMIMASLYFKKQIPFKNVYFTSIIRDEKGQKLSKSLGNSPDPLEVIETYGTDALRFTVVFLSPLGQDIRFSKKSCEQGRNFATKIWNAARFLFMNRQKLFDQQSSFDAAYKQSFRLFSNDYIKTLDEKWILSKLANSITNYHLACSSFRINDLAKIPYEFLWDDFCDWFIEHLKVRLQDEKITPTQKKTALVFAIRLFEESIKILHPIMPFITEEIWQTIIEREKNESISNASFAELKAFEDHKAKQDFEFIKHIILEMRSARALVGIVPSSITTCLILSIDKHEQDLIQSHHLLIEKLTRTKVSSVSNQLKKPEKAITAVVSTNTQVFITLEGIIDFEKEKKRLQKEVDSLSLYTEKLKAKLLNKAFTANAPKEIIESEKLKLQNAMIKKDKILENLKIMK